MIRERSKKYLSQDQVCFFCKKVKRLISPTCCQECYDENE